MARRRDLRRGLTDGEDEEQIPEIEAMKARDRNRKWKVGGDHDGEEAKKIFFFFF